jgi:DNA polymerase-3 subunit delta
MNAFIFLGQELGKKQDAVNNVKKNFKPAEEFTYYAVETSASTIADTLQNQGLFADSRLVIVKNAELIKKDDEAKLIASCIKKLEENTALILLSDENRLSAVLDDAVPKANRQVFYELSEREKADWVRSFFKGEGFEIDRDGIDTILEMVENNTSALKQECSRLIYFLPKGRPISCEEIEKWLSHNREESVSTLFSRIAVGDLSKALEATASMLAAKESAQGILAGLARNFRKLNDYLNLLETGKTDYLELKKIGLSVPKLKDDFAAASRRYNADAVEACLALTAECDILLRSPLAPLENILMDRYIIKLVNSGGKA